jgi:hypothetical protein
MLSSGVRRVGELSTSNALINTLMNNVYRTQRANFMDVPTDCPQRDERLGWLGDGQVIVFCTHCIAIALNFLFTVNRKHESGCQPLQPR